MTCTQTEKEKHQGNPYRIVSLLAVASVWHLTHQLTRQKLEAPCRDDCHARFYLIVETTRGTRPPRHAGSRGSSRRRESRALGHGLAHSSHLPAEGRRPGMDDHILREAFSYFNCGKQRGCSSASPASPVADPTGYCFVYLVG